MIAWTAQLPSHHTGRTAAPTSAASTKGGRHTRGWPRPRPRKQQRQGRRPTLLSAARQPAARNIHHRKRPGARATLDQEPRKETPTHARRVPPQSTGGVKPRETPPSPPRPWVRRPYGSGSHNPACPKSENPKCALRDYLPGCLPAPRQDGPTGGCKQQSPSARDRCVMLNGKITPPPQKPQKQQPQRGTYPAHAVRDTDLRARTPASHGPKSPPSPYSVSFILSGAHDHGLRVGAPDDADNRRRDDAGLQ